MVVVAQVMDHPGSEVFLKDLTDALDNSRSGKVATSARRNL